MEEKKVRDGKFKENLEFIGKVILHSTGLENGININQSTEMQILVESAIIFGWSPNISSIDNDGHKRTVHLTTSAVLSIRLFIEMYIRQKLIDSRSRNGSVKNTQSFADRQSIENEIENGFYSDEVKKSIRNKIIGKNVLSEEEEKIIENILINKWSFNNMCKELKTLNLLDSKEYRLLTSNYGKYRNSCFHGLFLRLFSEVLNKGHESSKGVSFNIYTGKTSEFEIPGNNIFMRNFSHYKAIEFVYEQSIEMAVMLLKKRYKFD